MSRLIWVALVTLEVSSLVPQQQQQQQHRLAPRAARGLTRVWSDADGLGVSNFEGGGVPSDTLTDENVGDIDARLGIVSPFSGSSGDDAESLKRKILALGASTARGEGASKVEKYEGAATVYLLEQLESLSPSKSAEVLGTWELVFSDTQLFRSSPFFMAGRAVCKDGAEANQYDWFCDMHRAALGMSQIQRVRQIVSETKLVSEFEVSAGSVPFLKDLLPMAPAYSGGMPFAITGAIVSTADIVEKDEGSWKLLMDTVEIKGSNIPGVRQALDSGVRLQSRDLGDFLETNVDSYTNPNPVFRTTYLDENFRVSRDQDDKIFVYVKSSTSTVPTEYDGVQADLGLGSLIDGVVGAFL